MQHFNKKEVHKGSISYTYTKDGLLLSQTDGTTTITFLYDANKEMIGIKKGTTLYYFHKNIQGDVIAVLNKNGNAVVKYVYDAWGNHKAYSLGGDSYVLV